jgi:protein O-GlcNAc transferase
MDATTAKLASLRLAPVQAASWGHPETSGLPTIDFYLSAQALEPADAQANYTEKLVALPNLGCWLVPTKEESGKPPALDLAADELVLLCPGNAFKYAPQHDRLLAAIAQRVPRSRLVFFRSRPEPLAEKLRARLAESFRRAGADFERQVTFLPWQSRASFRALLKRADLYLDTVGFSGFNTAVQALECGLPIVAREGRFLRGRLGSGVLRHLGLDALVAPSGGLCRARRHPGHRSRAPSGAAQAHRARAPAALPRCRADRGAAAFHRNRRRLEAASRRSREGGNRCFFKKEKMDPRLRGGDRSRPSP